MIENSPPNLFTAKMLGMKTILIGQQTTDHHFIDYEISKISDRLKLTTTFKW